MPRTDSSDSLADLIARCALRDEQAFARLYAATSAKLYGVVLRILKREQWAQEALQDGYVKVWEHADSYNRTRGAPMTWLINVMRNQALDVRRRPQYRAEQISDEVDDTHQVSRDEPLFLTQAASELRRLLQCMRPLAEKQRECILLIYHEGYTPTEVAGRLDLRLGTVKTWVRRGLMRIRECLGR